MSKAFVPTSVETNSERTRSLHLEVVGWIRADTDDCPGCNVSEWTNKTVREVDEIQNDWNFPFV